MLVRVGYFAVAEGKESDKSMHIFFINLCVLWSSVWWSFEIVGGTPFCHFGVARAFPNIYILISILRNKLPSFYKYIIYISYTYIIYVIYKYIYIYIHIYIYINPCTLLFPKLCLSCVQFFFFYNTNCYVKLLILLSQVLPNDLNVEGSMFIIYQWDFLPNEVDLFSF